jgi:hypothetical protein
LEQTPPQGGVSFHPVIPDIVPPILLRNAHFGNKAIEYVGIYIIVEVERICKSGRFWRIFVCSRR